MDILTLDLPGGGDTFLETINIIIYHDQDLHISIIRIIIINISWIFSPWTYQGGGPFLETINIIIYHDQDLHISIIKIIIINIS